VRMPQTGDVVLQGLEARAQTARTTLSQARQALSAKPDSAPLSESEHEAYEECMDAKDALFHYRLTHGL
jgi:hypothetical protein